MPSVKLDQSKIKRYEKLFIKLSWRILECKFLYYEGPKHNLSHKCISDQEYDKLEDRYLKLAKVLKKEPTAQQMVGFDTSKPSCKLVASSMIANKGETKIEIKLKKRKKK